MQALLDIIHSNPVVIFTIETCPYCTKAKKLLDQKNISYHEIDVSTSPHHRVELVDLSGGRRTVPQIFIHGKSIGGCDDLYQLEESGSLDPLLSDPSSFLDKGTSTWNASA